MSLSIFRHRRPSIPRPGIGRAARALLLGAAGLVCVQSAQAADKLYKVTFGTNWFAEAEHGGFYQAKATGLYKKAGLDVTIKMGGPQVNGLQLLLAGRTDFYMGYAIQTIKAVADGLPVVAVAGTFQKDPQAILAHKGVKSLAGLKGTPILVSNTADATFWPWLKQKYGYTDAMKRPYTFSVAPFLHDPHIAQQGYISAEPFAMEKAGVKPVILLMADYGYPPYAEPIVTTRKMIEEHPDIVAKFVKASIEGWKSYMANPAPGNVLIKKDDPQMTDAQLAYGLKKMKDYQLVTGGDAAKDGIGVMTDARWKRIRDFMVQVGMIKPSVDYHKAYSLRFIKNVHVFP
ncbi:MAG: ABC transporter substrate-binding protein [Gammaproteobacteria bacterium]